MAGELPDLIVRMIGPVEDCVAIDPRGEAAQFVVVKVDVVVAGAQHFDQATAECAKGASWGCGLDLVALAKAWYPRSSSVFKVGSEIIELAGFAA